MAWKKCELMLLCSLLDIFRVYGVTTTIVFIRAPFKSVISSYDVYKR
jgi:hypothetical protein